MSNFDDLFRQEQNQTASISDQPFDKEAWAQKKQEQRETVYALSGLRKLLAIMKSALWVGNLREARRSSTTTSIACNWFLTNARPANNAAS